MKSINTFKKIGVLACAVLLIVTLVGGVMAIAKPQPAIEVEEQIGGLTTTAANNLTTQSLTSVADSYISEAEAKTIALTHAGLAESEVSHMFCKLDYDDGIAEYEVEFWDGTTEYDYEINAVSGDIRSYDFDMESYDAKPTIPTTSTSADYISEAEAKTIALTHAGLAESEVSHMLCKLEYDEGIAEYEVEFWDGTTEYDYEINAVSGDIRSYDFDMESYDAKPTIPTTSTSADYISEAEAKAIALTHAGLAESEVGRIECEFDFDDGYAEYEVEWEVGRTEYEYTISATDGTIREHDVEYDD